MTAKKAYFLMMGFLALFILGTVATLYFGNWYMKKSATSLVNTKLDNVGSDAEEQTYLQARKDLEKYKTLNETISKILPKSKDQAQAVRELYRIGDETGIVIDKVQFPSSTLGQKVAPTPTPSSTDKNSSAPQSTTTATTSTVTQAKAVEGMPGVLGIDIQVGLQPAYGNSISYDNMIKFLQKVELNRRSMQIKQISVQTDTQNGGITFDITLTIFVKP